MFHTKPISLRKISYSICFLLFFSLLFQCEKEPVIVPTNEPVIDPGKEPIPNPLSHNDSLAISKLPKYYNFLVSLKEAGYIFYDFRTYLNTDTSLLPQKLIVIRHDVHYRDINWAYLAFKIEQIVIGAGHSTFYVMLNDPIETAYSNYTVQDMYMRLIQHLDSNDVDIQPHISPIDIYITNNHPFWERYSVDTLKVIFDQNYHWETNKSGKQIIVTGDDVLNLNDINNALITLLPKYNEEWTKQTQLDVQGYASHGSGTAMNLVLNNADILDQIVLLNSGIYQYDTYNTKIFNILTYLSDNYLPSWMTNPYYITPGRYQFLMHPYQWSF